MKKRPPRKSLAERRPLVASDRPTSDQFARYNKAMTEIFGPEVEFVSIFARSADNPIVWVYSTQSNEGQVELLKKALASYEDKKDWVWDGGVDETGGFINFGKGGKA